MTGNKDKSKRRLAEKKKSDPLKFCMLCNEKSVVPKKYWRKQDDAYCYREHCLNKHCPYQFHRVLRAGTNENQT